MVMCTLDRSTGLVESTENRISKMFVSSSSSSFVLNDKQSVELLSKHLKTKIVDTNTVKKLFDCKQDNHDFIDIPYISVIKFS